MHNPYGDRGQTRASNAFKAVAKLPAIEPGGTRLWQFVSVDDSNAVDASEVSSPWPRGNLQ